MKENTFGLKTETIKEIGNIIVCMGRVKLLGLMEDVTRGNINTIKNMDLVLSSGRMAGNISGIGRMVNSTVEDNTICRMVKRK